MAGTGIGSGRTPCKARSTPPARAPVRAACSSNDQAVAVDTVAAISVNRVLATGLTQTVTDAAQSDLASGGNGSIVLTSTAGNITLNDGTASPTARRFRPTAAATSSSTPSTAT